MNEEMEVDNFDYDNVTYFSDSEKETKLKCEPDIKPTVISLFSEKETIQKKEKSSVKNFKCPYCEYKSVSKKGLWGHVKDSHEENMEEYAGQYQTSA